jgi:hypothetical protein
MPALSLTLQSGMRTAACFSFWSGVIVVVASGYSRALLVSALRITFSELLEKGDKDKAAVKLG